MTVLFKHFSLYESVRVCCYGNCLMPPQSLRGLWGVVDDRCQTSSSHPPPQRVPRNRTDFSGQLVSFFPSLLELRALHPPTAYKTRDATMESLKVLSSGLLTPKSADGTDFGPSCTRYDCGLTRYVYGSDEFMRSNSFSANSQ